MKRISPPMGVYQRNRGNAGSNLTPGHFVTELLLAEKPLQIPDRHPRARACRVRRAATARQLADLPFQVAHARLARIGGRQSLQHLVADR